MFLENRFVGVTFQGFIFSSLATSALFIAANEVTCATLAVTFHTEQVVCASFLSTYGATYCIEFP
jgi:hypothetical protein